MVRTSLTSNVGGRPSVVAIRLLDKGLSVSAQKAVLAIQIYRRSRILPAATTTPSPNISSGPLVGLRCHIVTTRTSLDGRTGVASTRIRILGAAECSGPQSALVILVALTSARPF